VEGTLIIEEKDFVLTVDLEKQLNADLPHGETELRLLMEQNRSIEEQEKLKPKFH